MNTLVTDTAPLVTANNVWATALTEAEASTLFDTIQRGALRALDASHDAGADYHALRDTARDAAAIQANISAAFGWWL